VPGGGKAAFAAFRAASELREKALAAREPGDSIGQDRAGLLADIKDLNRRRKEDLEQIARTDQQNELQEYNALVADANKLGALIEAKQIELNQVYDDSAAGDQAAHSYMSAYGAFQRAYAAYAAQNSASPSDADFRDVMSRALKKMGKDFRQDRVVMDRAGMHMIADVLINGAVHARLIVDTGASSMILSPSIVKNLGPGVIRRGMVKTTVADGRVVPAEMIELDSVSVGGTSARHVTAVSMPSDLSGVDGLLGMSFLGRFSFETDPEAGVLILRRLREPSAPAPAAR
jgi:clan AA aspartic protease (TIGR02281 family)